jgi:hypothetical protein
MSSELPDKEYGNETFLRRFLRGWLGQALLQFGDSRLVFGAFGDFLVLGGYQLVYSVDSDFGIWVRRRESLKNVLLAAIAERCEHLK